MTEPMIYKAISAVMEDIGAVGKDKVNKTQGFKFRGIDDIVNALNPALIKNKVFAVPEIIEQSREERKTVKGSVLIYSICKVKYTFFTADGSSVCATVIGEGMDSGDKATNKAMSVAFKYACFQVFCIPTEELMDDPDEEKHEVSQAEKQKPAEQKPAEKKPAESRSENKKAPKEEKPGSPEPQPEKVSESMLDAIQKEFTRTGITEKQITSMFKVKKLEDLTVEQFERIMKKFKATPDKEAKDE